MAERTDRSCPHREQGWPAGTEVFLELRVERHVARVVEKQVELDLIGALAGRFPPTGVRPGQLYPAGRRASTVNPSFPSTATAPLLPPSKSPEARRWPVASS